jgi:Flp pilus assembly protein TadD
VCNERLKKWPEAEADFKQALTLSPDESLVLNYLGYSWVDQGVHLKQAMEYIRKAVKLKPDDGYYVDSLGWAYYRLGNLAAAVEHLERAVELKPDDPIINDHLGDAYWKVGRILEAKYQWQQALTLKPEQDLVGTLKQKIASGLTETAETKSAQDRTTQVGRAKTPQ